MSRKEREPVAGGSLGKRAGRARETAGNLLGRRDRGREGREVEVEAAETAAEDGIEDRPSALRREADQAEAAADRIDAKEES